MVIWVIGLSGSGKTTLAKALYDRLKPEMPNLVRLDGDVIRALFGNDVDHTVEGRRKNAERLSRLSKFLADQGIHIIAAVLSIFPEWQKWNRANISGYSEVYLKVSMEVLKKRDKNNLYLPAIQGKLKNVVGVDIPFPEPKTPDLVIDNNKHRDDFTELAEEVLAAVKRRA
ncbi:MAG: adenylyl-sulfate kinase [Candidatus Omnitrophica bacterium]|nr:adenylyl-sulfate kinase [Candidatus Omnitrophota bacterium]